MGTPRDRIVAAVLLLGGVVMMTSVLRSSVSGLVVASATLGTVGLVMLSAAVWTRRLATDRVVLLAVVFGCAAFLIRLALAPATTEEELARLEYLVFRGVVLLGGASFIALGRNRGLIVSVMVLLASAVTLWLGPLAGGTLDGGIGAVVMTVVLATIGLLMFRILASTVAVLEKTAADAERDAELAYLDDLTGLPNRRHMMGQLEASVAAGFHDSVVMFDLDHFKSINDADGHAAGDEVLRRAAAVVGGVLRSQDLLSRWGGEEFLILLPRTDLATAEKIAERCRAALSTDPRMPTASFGVTALSAGDTIDDVLRRADDALYRAKDAGRNRVVPTR